MRVSVKLPTGVNLEYNVPEEYTFFDLQQLIQQSEGIPPEMQQFSSLQHAKPTEVHLKPLKELFPESFKNEELHLNLLFGPLEGGLAQCDLCLCGCEIFSQGNCTFHVSHFDFILYKILNRFTNLYFSVVELEVV
jgi:hypothetical protein